MTTTSTTSYRSTITACYIGNFVQAASVNVTPILLILLREQYSISYAKFGLLIMLNYVTQVLVDILFSKVVDKYGYRIFIVSSHILCVLGFITFASAPLLFPNNVYLGLLVGTILFASASGLLELLLSTIVDAIPTKEKDKAMALLHSFYGWGQAVVVALTTLAVFFGVNWQIIVLAWAIIPFVNTFLFAKVPLCQKKPEDIHIGIRKLLVSPLFILCFIAIGFGGAAEVSMAQWASAFVEKGLQVPKLLGDMLGTCGFAIMLATGRALYASKIKKPPLSTLLCAGSAAAVICYLVAAVSPFPWLSIAACAACGFCASLLWPGTLVLASSKMPGAGASLFALLAAGGDVGAAVGPWLSGVAATAGSSYAFNNGIASPESFGLRIALLLASTFAVCCFIVHKILSKLKSNI